MNKECENCGKDFEAKRKTARFCGDSCRVSWNNKQSNFSDEERKSNLDVGQRRNKQDWFNKLKEVKA